MQVTVNKNKQQQAASESNRDSKYFGNNTSQKSMHWSLPTLRQKNKNTTHTNNSNS